MEKKCQKVAKFYRVPHCSGSLDCPDFSSNPSGFEPVQLEELRSLEAERLHRL